MKAVAFDYARAEDSGAAVKLLAEANGHARPIAGGQSLGPMLNLRLTQPSLLVDVRACADLKGTLDEGDAIVYGAGITHAELEDGAVPDATGGWLQHAARRIAYRSVRNVGTVGGSLAHADPAADWLTVMLAFDAEIIARGPDGLRAVALQDFVTGPFSHVLADNELIVAVRIGKRDSSARVGYRKLSVKVGEFARALSVVVDDPARGTRRAVVGAIERVPLVIDGEDLLSVDVPRAETILAERLPRLSGPWLRIHAVNLARAVADLSANGSAP